jgi:hypothetical protein
MSDDRIYTIGQYLETCTSLQNRIDATENLIDQMLLRMVDAVDTSDLSEYDVDDGQMKVRTRYRNIEDLERGIKGLQRIAETYRNRLNGRVSVSRGGTSIRYGLLHRF